MAVPPASRDSCWPKELHNALTRLEMEGLGDSPAAARARRFLAAAGGT